MFGAYCIFYYFCSGFLKGKKLYSMLQEKAGEVAGKIWNSLNENGAQDVKDLKKSTKVVLNDLYLGLGWLLREDKVISENGKFSLK